MQHPNRTTHERPADRPRRRARRASPRAIARAMPGMVAAVALVAVSAGLAAAWPAPAAATPQQVLLNEITTWAPQAIEIINTGADAPGDSTTIEALRAAGQSLCAIPDGAGPRDGFDLPTSGLGVTRFPCVPTPGGSNQGVPVEAATWGRIKLRQRR